MLITTTGKITLVKIIVIVTLIIIRTRVLICSNWHLELEISFYIIIILKEGKVGKGRCNRRRQKRNIIDKWLIIRKLLVIIK